MTPGPGAGEPGAGTRSRTARLAVPHPTPHNSRMRTSLRTLAALVAFAVATPAMAQDPAPSSGPKVGDMAPDFTLPASTQAGVSQRPVRLSELRGQVVVIAFFPKSRTRG